MAHELLLSHEEVSEILSKFIEQMAIAIAVSVDIVVLLKCELSTKLCGL